MKLSVLCPDMKQDTDVEICGVTADSRAVREGYLFAAMSGERHDGVNFIPDAIQNGAAAVLYRSDCKHDMDFGNVVSIPTDNIRADFSAITARFYNSQPKNISAVTGTNGKTSTVDFVRQLLIAAGYKAASLGTLGVRSETVYDYGSMTTPDPVTLHALLADLAGAGVTHLAMEASSHGLDQHRLDGVNLQVAAFTNLSHDHLDYHKDFESYLAAKLRLFSHILSDDGIAVINADIPEAEQILSVCQKRNVKTMTFGIKADGDCIKLKTRTAKPSGQDITIIIDGQDYDLSVPLVGDFQVMNVLCALGMIRAQGVEILNILPFVENLRGVPGRLQYVHVDTDDKNHGAVYVDYAHTPDALEKVLGALRPHTQGRLICVVGCGGDRDASKRPVMGRIAADKSDIVIITDDNPRTEDPALIRNAMMKEAQGALEIGDRKEAILKAVSMMKKGDVVLLAGKGHEQGQIVGETVLPFDDYKAAQSALKHKIKTGG